MRISSYHLTLPVFLLLTGCLGGFRVQGAPAPGPPFKPEEFFGGITHGDGVLSIRFKSDRHFHVASVGKSESDGTFVLQQTITYEDGAADTRTFRMRPVNDHEYTGSVTGSPGAVSASTEGNAFHVQFTMRQPHVTMEQWIYRQPDGRTALNRSTVRVLGVPVAHLSETITKD
jgi:hypothetical protein